MTEKKFDTLRRVSTKNLVGLLFPPLLEIEEELHRRGSKSVQPIISALQNFRDKEDGRYPYGVSDEYWWLSMLLRVVRSYARAEHAEALVGVLLWDRIALSEDQSNRGSLLYALRNIGTTAVIPCLERFKKVREKVWETPNQKHPPEDRRPFRPLSRKEKHALEKKEINKVIDACARKR